VEAKAIEEVNIKKTDLIKKVKELECDLKERESKP
jgi:hypothetical protein